jgi:hypothetical protein
MTDEVNARNIRALHEGLNENRKRLNDSKDEQTLINNRIAMLEDQVKRQNGLIMMLLSKTGGGSTSGN